MAASEFRGTDRLVVGVDFGTTYSGYVGALFFVCGFVFVCIQVYIRVYKGIGIYIYGCVCIYRYWYMMWWG